ncbi:hypothetical protein OXX80_001288 [Metschnikowia pulcherrima]
MSNLSSTSTEPHEEAVTSFVHSVRKYELKDQVYPLVGHMDYVHEFAASTTSLQPVLRTFRTPSYSGSYDGTKTKAHRIGYPKTKAHRIVLSSIPKYDFVQG